MATILRKLLRNSRTHQRLAQKTSNSFLKNCKIMNPIWCVKMAVCANLCCDCREVYFGETDFSSLADLAVPSVGM
jgi:hypothetical protein